MSLVHAAPAKANGRFPRANQVLTDPKDPRHLVLRATFGLVESLDAGAHWHWICEGAIGYGGIQDPMVALTSSGHILVAPREGLRLSRGDTCTWEAPASSDIQREGVDLATDPSNGHRVVLLQSRGTGPTKRSVEVLLSHDDGVTWARTPASPPEEFVGFTVDFAPGDGRTLYLSGFFDEEGHPGSLLRTKDAGAHWERLPIPGTDDARIPYIAGIPSNDPKTIFIRVDGYPMDSLLVTRDEGAHFTSSFESKASLFAFAISPDGQQAVVGGDRDGLWRTSLTNLTWEEGARINAWCARWDSGGLMACGNPLGDTFTLGRSEDQGKTFQPLLQFADISGPRTCPESSPVSKVCPGAWPALAPALGASLPDAGTKPQPIDAGETPAVDGGVPTATQAPTTASCRLLQRHPVGSALPVGLGLLAAFFARRQGRRIARPVQRHHEP